MQTLLTEGRFPPCLGPLRRPTCQQLEGTCSLDSICEKCAMTTRARDTSADAYSAHMEESKTGKTQIEHTGQRIFSLKEVIA